MDMTGESHVTNWNEILFPYIAFSIDAKDCRTVTKEGSQETYSASFKWALPTIPI